MTAEFLQDDLIAEVRAIFQQERFKNATGGRVPLAVYPQRLPVLPANEDDDGQYPYCIVRLVSGVAEDATSAQTVTALLIFGVIDQDRDGAGYRTVLHMIGSVYARFARRAQLGRNFICRYPIRWELQDEDTYPYYVGGMSVTFDIPAVRAEDPMT